LKHEHEPELLEVMHRKCQFFKRSHVDVNDLIQSTKFSYASALKIVKTCRLCKFDRRDEGAGHPAGTAKPNRIKMSGFLIALVQRAARV